MYWILLLFSTIIFFAGLAMLIGAGWTMALFHLVTQTAPSGKFEDLQDSFKGSKKPRYKLLGLFMVFGGLILFIYSIGRI